MAKCFHSIFIKKRILLFIATVSMAVITIIQKVFHCEYDPIKVELSPNEINLNVSLLISLLL